MTHGMALCAGAGGLELGLAIAIPDYRGVCYVEREAFAAATLVARMEEQALDPAPVWDDIATFDGRAWRGAVDLVSAGYPCQPFSAAGRRRGVEDERHLWPHVARIVGEVEPEAVFLENVAGHLRLGFDEVVADLGALGYRVAAGLFSAAEVGASHRRIRLFCLAHRERDRRQGSQPANGTPASVRRRSAQSHSGVAQPGRAGLEGPEQRGQPGAPAAPGRRAAGQLRGAPVADASGGELWQQPRRRHGAGGSDQAEPGEPEPAVADAAVGRRGEDGIPEPPPAGGGPGAGHPDGCLKAVAHREGLQRQAQLRGEPDGVLSGMEWPLFAPGPGDPRWPDILDIEPTLEPALCRVAHGMAHRVDRLRLLGNGVVPLQAATAYCTLSAALAATS